MNFTLWRNIFEFHSVIFLKTVFVFFFDVNSIVLIRIFKLYSKNVASGCAYLEKSPLISGSFQMDLNVWHKSGKGKYDVFNYVGK